MAQAHCCPGHTDAKQGQIDEKKAGKCSYCDATVGDMRHLLWHCPFFCNERIGKEEDKPPLDEAMENVDADALPPCLLVGLPHTITAKETQWCWEAPQTTRPYEQPPQGMQPPGTWCSRCFMQCLMPMPGKLSHASGTVKRFQSLNLAISIHLRSLMCTWMAHSSSLGWHISLWEASELGGQSANSPTIHLLGQRLRLRSTCKLQRVLGCGDAQQGRRLARRGPNLRRGP